jgi:hypothetical protein
VIPQPDSIRHDLPREAEHAFDVEFFGSRRCEIHFCERLAFAEPVAQTFVAASVHGLLANERLVQRIESPPNVLNLPPQSRRFIATRGASLFPRIQHHRFKELQMTRPERSLISMVRTNCD